MADLVVDIKYSGVQVHVSFCNSVSVLSGYSGTGKTFLMQAIDLYCRRNSIKCIYMNYRQQGLSIEQLKSLCSGIDVVLLDNADLYVSDDFIKWLVENGRRTILCMKDTSNIDMSNVSSYVVNYENASIIVEEF